MNGEEHIQLLKGMIRQNERTLAEVRTVVWKLDEKRRESENKHRSRQAAFHAKVKRN